MTSKDFVIWLKGFSEACHEFHPTPKQWDRIKEVLEEVDDNIEKSENECIEQPRWMLSPRIGNSIPLTGSISTAGGLGIITTTTDDQGSSRYSATVWNDQMGCWHYTNYPEGFGYYTNSTGEGKKEKQQLND
jgi:hypothetical protein